MSELPQQNISIVVVHPNLDDAFLLNCHLNDIKGLEFRFHHFQDHSYSMEEISSGRFDLVLISYRLGSELGTETVRKLRVDGYLKPLVLICSEEDQHEIPEMMRSGADDCLPKNRWTPDALEACIGQAIEHAEQRNSDKRSRTLLSQTLNGAMRVLIETLAMLRPAAMQRAKRARDFIRVMAKAIDHPQPWNLETATMLSQLGCLHIPEMIIRTVDRNRPLTLAERELFLDHPAIGAGMVRSMPRLDSLAEIVEFQERHYDGSGPPYRSEVVQTDIPLGARCLKICLDYQALLGGGYRAENAIEELQRRTGWYDLELLEKFSETLVTDNHFAQKTVTVHELTSDMIVTQTLATVNGDVLVPEGNTVSDAQRQQLLAAVAVAELPNRVHVRVPIGSPNWRTSYDELPQPLASF